MFTHKIFQKAVVLLLCLALITPFVAPQSVETVHAQSTGNLIGGGIAISGAAATVGATINAALIGTLTLSAIPVAGWVTGLFLVIACLALCGGSNPTPQTPGFVGVTVRDNGGLCMFGCWGEDKDSNKVNARYAYEINGSWSSGSTDNDQYSPDRIAIYNHNQAIPPGLDFQLCVNATNKDSGNFKDHDPQCTKWASESTAGSWSELSKGFPRLDAVQISARSRPLVGAVTDYRFGVQTYKGGSSSCGSAQTAYYTTWNRGWSSYSGTSDQLADVHCVRVYLQSTLDVPKAAAPQVSLFRIIGPGAQANTKQVSFDDASIAWDAPLELGWDSVNTASCTSSQFDTGNRTSSGFTNTVTPTLEENQSVTYRIDCTGLDGTTTSDTLRVTRQGLVRPTGRLYLCNTTQFASCIVGSLLPATLLGNGNWTTSNMNITAGHELAAIWTSGNGAVRCNGSGTNFTTGSALTGLQTNITEPALGESTEYSLTCYDASNVPSLPARIRVEAQEAIPVVTVSPTVVKINQPFTISWDLNGNNPDTCKFIAGPAAPLDVVGQSSAELTARGTTTYTLRCAGGTGTATIQIVPQLYES